MIDHAVSRFGRLDCLVNNAGSGSPMVSITEATAEQFDGVFAVNVRGVFFGIKHAAAVMLRQGAGSIITIASVAGLRGGLASPIYSGSKAAASQLTRSAAAELSHAGIRLNCISPGGIVTGILAKAAGVSGADADRVLGVIRNRSPRCSLFLGLVKPMTSLRQQCSLRATRRHSSLVRTLPLTAAWFPSAITAGTVRWPPSGREPSGQGGDCEGFLKCWPEMRARKPSLFKRMSLSSSASSTRPGHRRHPAARQRRLRKRDQLKRRAPNLAGPSRHRPS